MQSSICRYCLSDENSEDFITPCDCSTPVHKECLKKWYIVRQNKSCEICHEMFDVQYKYIIVTKSYISSDAKFSICISFLMFICIVLFFFCFLFLLSNSVLNGGQGIIYALGLVMIAIALSICFMGVMDVFKIVKTIR